MARVIVSSSNFMRHVRAFDALGADYFELSVSMEQMGCLVCKGHTGRTELPCESTWFGNGAMVSVPKLLAALKKIEDQPITLDLHDGAPCKLYACTRTSVGGEWDNVDFAI